MGSFSNPDAVVGKLSLMLMRSMMGGSALRRRSMK